MPGGGVRHRRARPERGCIQIVDRRQAAREKLTEDDPLRQAFNATEVEPLRKLLQRGADEALVARCQHGKTIPQHDPTVRGRLPPALVARVHDHFE